MTPSQKEIAQSFDDIDLFSFNKVVEAWNLDFLQLGTGVFRGNLSQLIYPNYQFAYALFSTGVKQEGFSPEGLWTFAFVNDTQLHWRNYLVEPESIIIYAPGSAINAVSSAGFEVMTFSISHQMLSEIANSIDCQDYLDELSHIEILKTADDLWSELRTIIYETIVNSKEENQNINDAKESFSFAPFVIQLLELMMKSKISANAVSNVSRLEVLRNAEKCMKAHAGDSITIKEIAKKVGVSERTLLYSFKKRYGIGPKGFKKILNLNRVYIQLRVEKDTTISAIARENGFWHMGQFVRDYKLLFGEIPTLTLQKESEVAFK